MTCLCGHRGSAGPSACVLEKGHEGDHKYGDYQQALAIAAAKELHSLRDQLAAAQAREAELMADNARLRKERDQLREQVKVLRDALLTCSVGDFSTGHVIHPSFDEKLVEEALAATELQQ